ncbi:MAG TPA: 4Fe-4S dicluster domain-containing protein [Bacteroidota bacterium]|nr:4Fe-4S dicluster domain-containing protein [Bacteroidota bacterium]
MLHSKALLIDITKCIGCHECQRACAETNHLSGEPSSELSATHYTALQSFNDETVFVRRLCMHCNQPTCVSACLVGAFTKTDTGAVLYDESKCIGCRYCMQACPFEVPRYEWGSLVPKIQKCRMCHERVAAGQQTACAEACVIGATLFGDRDDLVKEARKRIDENPGQYVDYIYGLNEAGGTSVLFLSAMPFEKLGFPMNVPKEPIPDLSWRVLSQIPKYAVAAGVVLFGINWITARRTEVARFEAEQRRLHSAPQLEGSGK